MSIRKRVLALAAAGAAALLLGGVVSTTHQATRVDASGATHAAIGCANSNNATDIDFPTTAVGPTGVITTSNQSSAVAPTGAVSAAGVVPALLSVSTPNAVVLCGAVFQDDPAATAAAGQDADANTIDGGSITFNLASPIGMILESQAASFSVQCGSTTTPELCQGAVPNATLAFVSPNPGNTIHLALRPGATFGLIGAGSPVITLSATYIRFASLPAVAPAGSPTTATTNAITVGLAVPQYASQLVPSPATISATAGAQASTLTMSLYHLATACSSAIIGGVNTVILTPQVANGLVVCGGVGSAVAQIQQFVAGAESGVVTFTTSDGLLANTTIAQGGGQQILSEHCGAIPNTVPTILIPTLGIATTFAETSCQTATAQLYGGGNVGTAVVVANFVGDFTGATTQATTQVQLAFNSTVNLTRGCNEVVTGPSTATAPVNGTVSGLVTNLVSPSSAVVSVWMFNNSTHAFQAGFFSTAGAPTDFSTVGAGQSLFICVNGSATFNNQ